MMMLTTVGPSVAMEESACKREVEHDENCMVEL